ncbi:DUF5805 domain-containing protein [Haladaptatus pallidirubidus]|uniref:DUF5805 domain-containing protein n=1 Tax=Haladaptatus pallidirubidus TaxID=1008152 RepID=A0AAV3UBQ8_9EURY|nr:DUF5805 domain-containing protein [Haladaptatus pallidirubidus]
MPEETNRTVVKTYIPEYQKDEWRSHADELDMSQSEFVRTMVQAGRRGFEINPAQTSEGGSNPRGDELKTRLLETLASEEKMSWDELVERLAGNFEDRLENALNELQSANRVQYSGRHGGYTLVGGVDGRT